MLGFNDYVKMKYKHSPYPDTFDKWRAERMDHPGLYTRSVICKDFNWSFASRMYLICSQYGTRMVSTTMKSPCPAMSAWEGVPAVSCEINPRQPVRSSQPNWPMRTASVYILCFFRVCIFHACTGLWPLKRFNKNLNLNYITTGSILGLMCKEL